MAYQRKPAKDLPVVNYDGREIQPINKLHWKQQIHKYNIALFTTGIIAMATALVTIVLTAIAMTMTADAEAKKPIATAASSTTLVFVITLGIDIVLTVMLNKYYKNKLPLILFIPAFALMVMFCVPELIALVELFGIKAGSWKGLTGSWSSYVIIAICAIFIILELLRMIIHRDDLDIYAEIKGALK